MSVVTAVTAVDGARVRTSQTRASAAQKLCKHTAPARVVFGLFFFFSFACRRPGDPQRCCRPRACARLLFFVVCFAPRAAVRRQGRP